MYRINMIRMKEEELFHGDNPVFDSVSLRVIRGLLVMVLWVLLGKVDLVDLEINF